MIVTRTVYVLGAGASYSYGYPLGGGLFQEVLQHFPGGAAYHLHLVNHGFSPRDIDRFLVALSRSGNTSVDAFLERRHEEFLDIGKAAMAVCLIMKEDEQRLWQQPDNWMVYLYGLMRSESLEAFAQNNVAFVTFNYDRTLEHFLCTSLSNDFGRSIEECAKVLKQIPIVHLHGRLGYLPWQNVHGREYGDCTINAQTINGSVKEIRVVHEDIADRDEDFSKAKTLLGEADRVYLMGFGFGTKNVERIGLAQITPKIYLGTAYQLTSRETAYSQHLCGGKPTLINSTCLNFLRDHFEITP